MLLEPEAVIFTRVRRNHSVGAKGLKRTPLFFMRQFLVRHRFRARHAAGHNSSLDARAKSREIMSKPRTIWSEVLDRVPDSRSGLIMGDFLTTKAHFHRKLRLHCGH